VSANAGIGFKNIDSQPQAKSKPVIARKTASQAAVLASRSRANRSLK